MHDGVTGLALSRLVERSYGTRFNIHDSVELDGVQPDRSVVARPDAGSSSPTAR